VLEDTFLGEKPHARRKYMREKKKEIEYIETNQE
jgi:hypothetical protein